MNSNKAVKTAIRLPLAGLVLTWIFFMAAQYSDLFYPFPEYDFNGNYIGPEPSIHISTYLFLVGIVSVSIFSLLGQRLALRQRTVEDTRFAIAAHRFTNLGVILSLVGGAIFAIGTFLGAFNNYSERDASPLVRILGVYLPIILAAALVVTVLLFAFVFRQDAPDLPHAERDEDRAALQRAIGLAYATPIIGTAIAIIFGLIVYDTTKTELDVWIWVVIQAIIATSILIGTRFAAKARLARPLPPRERQTGAAAVNLNLVLTIVFGAVVAIMSFSFGFSAIENLRDFSTNMLRVNGFTVRWFLEDLLPAVALLLLVVFGLYRSILLRHGQTGRAARKAAKEQAASAEAAAPSDTNY